jgi:hypothetical protein
MGCRQEHGACSMRASSSVRLRAYGLLLALGAALLQACLNPRPEDFPSSGDNTPGELDVTEGPELEEPGSPPGPPAAPAPGQSVDSPDAGAPADAGTPRDAGPSCSDEAAAAGPADGGSTAPE